MEHDTRGEPTRPTGGDEVPDELDGQDVAQRCGAEPGPRRFAVAGTVPSQLR